MGCIGSRKNAKDYTYQRINKYNTEKTYIQARKPPDNTSRYKRREVRQSNTKQRTRNIQTRTIERIATTKLQPEHYLKYPKTYRSQFTSKFELMVKRALERMFPQVGFRTVRPWFNMGAKGRPLELDMYSHCFRLSVEAHGKQHYEFVPKFQKTINVFYAQQGRDQMTRDNMKEVGITHIEVPYTCKTEEDVIKYIEIELEKLGGYEPVFYCGERCKHAVNWREDRKDL